MATRRSLESKRYGWTADEDAFAISTAGDAAGAVARPLPKMCVLDSSRLDYRKSCPTSETG